MQSFLAVSSEGHSWGGRAGEWSVLRALEALFGINHRCVWQCSAVFLLIIPQPISGLAQVG